MPIRGLADFGGVEAEGGDEIADLGERQSRVQGVGEHLLLMGVGLAGIEFDQPA